MGTLLDFHSVSILLIFLPAGLAERSPGSKGNLSCTLTDPSLNFSWVSINQSIIRNILGYDRTSSNKGILTYRVSTNNGHVGAKSGTPSDESPPKLFHPRYEASRVENIGK